MRGVIALVSFLSLATPSQAQHKVGDREFRELFQSRPLVIESARSCQLMEIFIAATPAQRARGLMFVRGMPTNSGMLFIYDGSAILAMWMKNTVIPLDIVFISARGQIVNIARDTKPFSMDTIPAAAPVSFVLELNAGKADELGLTDGQTIFYPELTGL